MTLFLFVKQFVDMLYRYRVLDYIMVIWVLLLLLYQIALVRPDFRKMFSVADGIVLLLVLLLSVSFLKNQSGYQIYFKVLSAFLMYFVGRVYYDRIKECYGALVSAAYIIIYLNLFARIKQFGFALTTVTDAGGDLYFYDTDMAFAMILAMVFIAMFGKNSVFKLITVFVVCPYMVICSDAGIQVMLLIAVYAIMAIYVAELVFGKKKLFNYLLSFMMVGLIGIVCMIYLPLLGIDSAENVKTVFDGRFLSYANMHVRYQDWAEALTYVKECGIVSMLFGTGMGAEVNIESLYIKIFYSLGYIGLLSAAMLIVNIMYYIAKVEDRKTFYLAVIMAVLLLGTGVTVNSMEATQMSWFPLLFAGMVVSSVSVENIIEEKEER